MGQTGSDAPDYASTTALLIFSSARGLGYDDRRHLRARLDALYFHLDGLSRDDAGYVLDTFPIVRRADEKQFGYYRTRDMVLAYMNALAAGDTETRVAV